MPSYTTLEEAVEAGAEAFANAEADLVTHRAVFRDLKDVFEKVRDEAYIGGIECLALSAECDEVITTALSKVLALHLRLTNRAKELGIDLPSIESGGR